MATKKKIAKKKPTSRVRLGKATTVSVPGISYVGIVFYHPEHKQVTINIGCQSVTVEELEEYKSYSGDEGIEGWLNDHYSRKYSQAEMDAAYLMRDWGASEDTARRWRRERLAQNRRRAAAVEGLMKAIEIAKRLEKRLGLRKGT